MADIEKVIKAWECCNPFNRKCKECPYEKDCYHDGISRHMVADALALLKEQKTGHWIYLENCSNSGVYCSECNTKVFDNYPFKKKFSYFCPHCGTRMEGETERR